jgi:hypothetical protein
MTRARQLRYLKEIRPEDTERAKITLKPSFFPDEAKPIAILFSGTCPCCDHPIEHRHWLLAVAGSLRVNEGQMESLIGHLDAIGVDLSHGDETVDITCPCDHEHPGCPTDGKGCGRTYRVRAVW